MLSFLRWRFFHHNSVEQTEINFPFLFKKLVRKEKILPPFFLCFIFFKRKRNESKKQRKFNHWGKKEEEEEEEVKVNLTHVMIKNRKDLQRRVSISLEMVENSSKVEPDYSKDTAEERDEVEKSVISVVVVASEPYKTSKDNLDRPVLSVLPLVNPQYWDFSVELFQLMIRYFSNHFSQLVSVVKHKNVLSFHHPLLMVTEDVLLVELN